jgi:hypothetical protein
MSASLPEAQLKAVAVEGAPDGTPDVIAVDFDARTLRITVEFFRAGRDWFYLEFRFPRGFRVLDEGDLLEFWRDGKAQGSFLFEVVQGGWFDLEAQRSGFIYPRGNVTEYLVVGEDKCVSVLALEPPQISVCK